MPTRFWATGWPCEISRHGVAFKDGHAVSQARPNFARAFLTLALLAALTVSVCLLLPRAAHAQLAPANQAITNQAAATYTDGSGVSRSAQSNIVTTTVQQVAAETLVTPGSVQGVANETETFPHTVTNTGNGTDTFRLSATDASGDDFNIAPQIFADANQDGQPDNATPITTTGALAPGGTFSFVVVGTVPTGVTANQVARVTVTATSNFDATSSATNTDTVTVTTNADVQATKTLTDLSGTPVTSGAPGSGPYRITLSFTNNGAKPATAITTRDPLDAGFSYVAASGRSSLTGATALTDDTTAESSPVITYRYDAPARTVRTNFTTIAAGATVSVSFNVTITTATAPGALTNTVTYDFFDGSNNQTNKSSNTVTFNVNQVATLTYTGQTLGPVAQGATVTFTNPLVNTGNGTDTFNIRLVTGNTFPAGTTFRLLNSAGTALLTDSDADGTVDTGPLAAGATFNVLVEAQLPIGAFGTGPYNVQTSATSKANPTVFATATDVVSSITRSVVDLQNAPGQGSGAGPETTPVRTDPGARGQTVRIPITVVNSSSISDSFNLDYSTTTDFNPAVALPTGYTVTFRNSANNVVTNTGTLAASGTFSGFADVFVPATATPVDLDLYFRALSPTTTAQDIIHDRISVGSERGLSLSANQSGTIFENQSTVYTETLTNTGNIVETAGTIGTTDSQTGFSSTVYVDSNNNGVFDGADQIVTNLSQISVGTGAGLDPGEQVRLFVKVNAPAGAVAGTQDNTLLTVTATGGTGAPTATTTDTSTVVAGRLDLLKEQALDANNDGAPDTAYSNANITTGAIPGAGLRYRITVTNSGQSDATNVLVTDPTPTYTKYSTGDGTTSATGAAVYTLNGTTFFAATSAPTNGNAGTLSWNIGTLTPGQSATIYFGVKING